MKSIIHGIAFGLAILLAGNSAHAIEQSSKALVAQKAAIVELMHSKARKALVTAAQDSRYRDYFTSQTDEERTRLKGDIDTIST